MRHTFSILMLLGAITLSALATGCATDSAKPYGLSGDQNAVKPANTVNQFEGGKGYFHGNRN